MKCLSALKMELQKRVPSSIGTIELHVNRPTYEVILEEVDTMLRYSDTVKQEEAWGLKRQLLCHGIIIKEKLCTCGAYDR